MKCHNNKDLLDRKLLGVHFNRSGISVGVEKGGISKIELVDLNNGGNNRVYPLCALYYGKKEWKYGTAAKDVRFMYGVFVNDIFNFIGKEYTEIPYPESYDNEIKRNEENSVSFIINERKKSETVNNIFKKLMQRCINELKEHTQLEEISYVLTIPPYFTRIQTQIIKDTMLEYELKLVNAIFDPIASVFVHVQDNYLYSTKNYIVIDLDEYSFTGSVVTVKDGNISLNYYIRDDDLGYTHLENNFITSIYDKLSEKYEINNKKQQKYKTDLENIFHSISCCVNYNPNMDDLDVNIEKSYVVELWQSLTKKIHKRIHELSDFINDNELKYPDIVLSGSGCQFALFRECFSYIFHTYNILDNGTNLSEIVVNGATLLANDSRGYTIDSMSFIDDMSFGIDLGSKYSICSCFKDGFNVFTKKFTSFIDSTYQPATQYINSEEDLIKIDKDLLRKMKNNICLNAKYITTDLPTVFTIPLCYSVNQKYDLKKEAEEGGYKVLSLVYSSFAAVIYSIYCKLISKCNCKMLVFNYGKNDNEMCIINKEGKRIELNTDMNLTIDGYTYSDISKLFKEYLSNDEEIYDENKKIMFNDVVKKINKNVNNTHEIVDYILVVGDLENFPMLKDNIESVFSKKSIIYLSSDCISVGASIYANQLLTNTDTFEIIDYSEYDDLSFGIDLGTTYSAACFTRDNKNWEMIDNQTSSSSFPSSILFVKNKNNVKYFVEKSSFTPKDYPVYDSKRFIGKSYNELNEYEDSRYLFKLIENNKKVYYDIEFNNSQLLLSPEDVSATILKHLKQKSIKRIKTAIQPNTVIPCVITTPALFTYRQRYETKRAAQKAGLNVLSIINEPTAAAIAYLNDDDSIKDQICKIIVYDFGGGTFDVSIVEKNYRNLRVICSDGDDHLGGEDITNRLVEYISADVKSEFGLTDIEKNLKKRIIGECETVKKDLSKAAKIDISLEYKDKTYKKTISRDELDEMCRDIYNKTITIIKRCIKNNYINKADIKYILFCGGSSRIPCIKERIEKEFESMKVMNNIHCKEAVARGAAIYANILRGKQRNFVKVADILNHSLYYEYSGNKGKLFRMFEKNAILDECHIRISIMTEDIGYAWIKIYEKKNGRKEMINRFDISSDYRRNVKVYFDVNSDGVLAVSYILNGAEFGGDRDKKDMSGTCPGQEYDKGQ